jgi:PPOX class probable FMN-dependent enzyme
MSAIDPYHIDTVEELRAVIGPNIPGVELKVQDHLDEFAREFVSRSPFVILSTAGADGRQDASPKGDGPGFVLVEDARTIVIPDRPGNKLVFGLQNILANPHVGLLFLIPGTNETLRIAGRAELTRDPALLQRLEARGKPAVLAIRVNVEECFFHCAKALLRSELWKPECWPERLRISFGRIMLRKVGGDEKAVTALDAAVEQDYRTNL